MSVIDGLRSHYEGFGLGGVLSIARHRLTRRNERIRVRQPGIEHPITLRLRTSDHRVFRDVFRNHEYLFTPPRPPVTIVDAGANIGLASVYFANRWPDAWIIAIEPDAENFAVLRENVERYPRIIPVQAAVWKAKTRLDMVDPGGGAWAMQTRVSEIGTVEGLTIPEIMRRYSLPHIDFLKMDIEGAEREVFERHEDWIDRIGSIAIETHDRLVPGSHEAVMDAAKHFKDVYKSGSTWFMLREVMNRPVAPMACRARVL